MIKQMGELLSRSIWGNKPEDLALMSTKWPTIPKASSSAIRRMSNGVRDDMAPAGELSSRQ
ncbi:MAG: hypothetical protein AAB413_03170 [Patescibacteria group bacterium]